MSLYFNKKLRHCTSIKITSLFKTTSLSRAGVHYVTRDQLRHARGPRIRGDCQRRGVGNTKFSVHFPRKARVFVAPRGRRVERVLNRGANTTTNILCSSLSLRTTPHVEHFFPQIWFLGFKFLTSTDFPHFPHFFIP